MAAPEGHRKTHTPDGTPVQQSLTIEPRDYKTMQMNKLMLGVVLRVYPSDDPQNRPAQQTEDRHGFAHECDVLVINDGSSATMKLRRVIITPDSPSGLDDYEERLPRGSTGLTTGAIMDPVLHGVDPFDLDGDLCVVGFLGGMIDSPFILRWWPHPRNLLDPATSAQGQDGKTLPQERRYFRRINGVETVINPEGDITISTTFANSKLNHSKDPVKGRVARDEDADVGGSIKAYVKPSQVLRIDFNEQVEGIGVFEAWDKSLPQTNPPKVSPTAPSDFPQTFIEVDSGNYVSRVPDNNDIYAGKDIRSESAENTRITVGTDYVVDVSGTGAIRVDGTLDLSSDSVLTLDGSQIMHGANASTSEPVILGQKMQDWMVSFTVDSPFGPLPATIAYAQTLVARTGSSKNFVE